jgi:hypothetical protein
VGGGGGGGGGGGWSIHLILSVGLNIGSLVFCRCKTQRNALSQPVNAI